MAHHSSSALSCVKEANQTILYFLDERLYNAKYVCATWTDDDDEEDQDGQHETRHNCSSTSASAQSSSQRENITNLKSISIEHPLDSSFFTKHNFIKLAKLDLTSLAFRTPSLLNLSTDFTFPLPALKCLNLDLRLPSISWIFPQEAEIQLNHNTGLNFTTFLRILTCPALTSFHLHTNEDKYRAANWEIEIFEFLSDKAQLKIIDLNFGNILTLVPGQTSDFYRYVSGLHPYAPLEILFIQYASETSMTTSKRSNRTAAREESSRELPNYWTLVLHQSHLVLIDLMNVTNLSLNELSFLVRRNSSTLQALKFHFIFSDDLSVNKDGGLRLDGEAFASCHALSHLKFNPGLYVRNPKLSKSTIVNFQALPSKSITNLSLANLKLRTDVLAACLIQFENLEFLQLLQCGTEPRGFGVTVGLLLKLFRLRKLNKLIVLPIVVEDDDDCKKLDDIEKLLNANGPEYEFVRHRLPPPLRRGGREGERESFGYLLRYCQIT